MFVLKCLLFISYHPTFTSMKRALALFLALFLPLVAAQAAVIKGSLTATSNNSMIMVRWASDDDAGISGYEVARKSGLEGAFIVLAVTPLTPDRSYLFVDETAFRTSDSYYQYRITPVYADGRTVEPFYVTVTHSVSSVRRTWGSIKAMFR
jgi:hypothetical protein